ncbi:hypothetical protein [Fibrella arboris]|uniref:hypothetical protein n=1 Tax=Fibrella arboris TaxID=3242486 RepID=UPI00351F92E5
MKSITFSIDLKSFFLGALLIGGLLMLANFKPADPSSQDASDQNRRYEAITGEKGTVILDTRTGKFLTYPHVLGRVQWEKGDFNAIQAEERKK